MWVCVASALPVKVGVWAIALATPPVVLESAPVVKALIVPAGVPPLVAPVVVVPFVPAGVPPLVALVVAELPVKVWAGTVPALPENVGTPAGQAIVPEGVKLVVPFEPTGV